MKENLKIKKETHGFWVKVRADVTSLRASLGLPSQRIFGSGTCNDYAHNEKVGPDAIYTDRSAIQPPHPKSSPRLTPAPTLPVDCNDGDSNDSYSLELEGV